MSIRDTLDGDIRYTSQGDRRITSQDEGPPPTPSLPGTPLGAPMGLQFALYEEPGGRMLVDFSPDVTGLVISDGPHGHEMMQANMDLILRQAARHYSGRWVAHAELSFGPEVVWEGRLEDRRLNDAGLGLSSFGYWREMFDAPYTALWSKTGTADWRMVTSDNEAAYAHEAFEGDNNNRLYLAPRQDEDYDNLHIGAWSFATPHNSERQIVAVDFDYILNAPTDWAADLGRGAWDNYGTVSVWSVISTGGLKSGTVSLVLAPGGSRLTFSMYYNDGTPTTYTGATGDKYLKITNLRIATTTRDRVDTTLGSTIAAGTRTVTPGSMANIYVGQQLRIGEVSALTAETVVVTAVTSTTFTAVFANGHNSADTVNAIVVYADEIAASLAGYGITHIADSAVLIAAHDVDLTDEVYEDALPADILNDLAARGDRAGNKWEVGIRAGRRLFFRPRGNDGRTWYVDATSIDIERTLDIVANRTYALYRDGNGWNRRTTWVTNDLSVRSLGIARMMAVPAPTTSEAQAEIYRAAGLDFYSDPPPRQVIQFDRLWTAGGALVRHKWRVRAGDTIVLRNVDPTLLADNQSTEFRIGRVHYNAATDELAVEPEVNLSPFVPVLINGVPFVPRELPAAFVQLPNPVPLPPTAPPQQPPSPGVPGMPLPGASPTGWPD